MTTTTSPPPTTAPLDRFSVATWQRRALVAGGVLFAVGNALHPLEHTDAAYRSATWETAHLVILVSVPLLVLGLPVLHGPLRRRLSGRMAAIAVGATAAGTIGLAPGLVIEAFVAPSIGHEAMQALERGGMGIVNGLFGAGYLGGSLALGWAARRARLRPGWAGPALLVATTALVVCTGFTGPVGGALIITMTAIWGLTLSALGLRHETTEG
jgi:hypothetical protein